MEVKMTVDAQLWQLMLQIGYQENQYGLYGQISTLST